MHFSFQDKDYLYLVMDYLTGGDLRYHLTKHKKFSENETKFFIACILLGLEYCHYNKIIHRDIKPENLVLDDKGYVKLTDFGIARLQVPNNTKDTSGTPGYMAPEVLCAQDHTIAVDYFALGVIGYEFMKGDRPYIGRSRKEIKEKVMAKQVQIKRQEIEEGWSVESADFINRMLQRKPMNRLGVYGAQQAKEHVWFSGFNWRELYKRKMESPFKIKNGDNFDYRYCNKIDRIGLKTKERYRIIKESESYINCYNDYYYFNRIELDNKNEKSEKFDNPHIIYEHNNFTNSTSHYRNRSNEERINPLKPIHRSNSSVSFNTRRNIPSTSSGITTGLGTSSNVTTTKY